MYLRKCAADGREAMDAPVTKRTEHDMATAKKLRPVLDANHLSFAVIIKSIHSDGKG